MAPQKIEEPHAKALCDMFQAELRGDPLILNADDHELTFYERFECFHAARILAEAFKNKGAS